ncbi:AlpA family transcriptional regulator [Pseudoalteromonas sp. SCSIO_11900]|uniref:helix-turn-helix transcriptional regulator n=1 Tax=Pseudoalteromonas sp. SCSIO_11900 TaxID=1461766 RepID=UPI0004458AC0|nr:AlpA family phage regulatory protein [Pseudoalteromonas sp. SCSIO_11900]EWS98163.1 AlpA family transcriptional regulator [Pseudoalteromonas sp. SCSIO_11900]
MSNLKLVRKSELLNTFACGKTLLQHKINSGLIPPPIKLGLRAVAFYEHEVNATLAVTIAGYSNKQIKDFVSELVTKRKNLLAQYTHLEAAND